MTRQLWIERLGEAARHARLEKNDWPLIDLIEEAHATAPGKLAIADLVKAAWREFSHSEANNRKSQIPAKRLARRNNLIDVIHVGCGGTIGDSGHCDRCGFTVRA